MAEVENYDVLSESSSQATDGEKALAQGAQTEFEKSNYAAAIELLSKLETSRPQDPKVMHNKAVVNCYKTGQTNVIQLRKSFGYIAKQLQCSLDDPKTLADVDQCYVFYNEAITLYYLRQYAKSLEILVKIFSLVEQLDEGLARQVCFLLAEVYLRLKFPGKTLLIVHFMETSLLSHGAKLKSTLPLERERERERDCDKEKDDLKSVFNEESLIPPGIRVRLQRLKIRAHVALLGAAEAKSELKILTDIDAEHCGTACLNSRVKYLEGNYKEALKNLKCANDEDPFKVKGESIEIMHNNNLGCTYHALGKYHLACLYFQKALARTSELLAEFPKPATGIEF